MKYYLDCSVDAVDIDYTQEITAEQAADFWACYDIAEAHGCSFFSVSEA